MLSVRYLSVCLYCSVCLWRWCIVATSPKRGRSAQFSAHVYCGKTAGWIKMALAMEVSVGPGHIELDGVPASAKRAQQPPLLFDPCLLWPWSPISATAELLSVLWPSYGIGQAIIFSSCGFFLLSFFPLPSNRHHQSNDDCLEGKRENYQVCSVQYCVQQFYTLM